jgi:alpha-D-ribose 1-methylphosphonate 5-triphosphate synthase subunit PhnG
MTVSLKHDHPERQDHPDPDRRRWMAVLARADGEAITRRLAEAGPCPGYACLRGPESGLTMVRGRIGGSGGAFNFGEMTVTRCTIRTDDGLVGHAYVAGRNERQAELAALLDALMQDAERRPALEASVIAPLAAEQQARRDARAAKAAATKVQFFAMRTMRT